LLVAPESVHVVTGQTVPQTFHVRSGTVRVRLLDAKDRPVAGSQIELTDDAGGWRRALPPTDADGRTASDFEADSYTASVLPKHVLQKVGERPQYRIRATPDPHAAERLRCGSVVVAMGTTTEVELRLDIEWPR
jgi:hypothetical protein